MYHLTSIKVQRFASHLHPGPGSPAFNPQDSWVTPFHVPFKFHLSTNIRISPSPSAKSQDLHLTSSQAPENCIWAALMSLKPSNPSLKMWMSNASRSFLTYIQDPRFLSHLHPCTISPPSRYQDSTKAPIYVPHLHLGHVSPPSRAHLTSSKYRELHLNPIIVPSDPIQVSKCAFHLNPGLILHTSMSQEFVPHLLTGT